MNCFNGSIVPAFGANSRVDTCGCSSSLANQVGAEAHGVPLILAGLVLGAVLAYFGRGGNNAS